MFYTKQQVAATANFIADKLIDPEHIQVKKWFCLQFKQVARERSQAERLHFSLGTQDFRALLSSLQQKNITVPVGFEVILYKDGQSIFRDTLSTQTICRTKRKEKVSPFTKRLADKLEKDIEDSFDSSARAWEAAFLPPAKPMLFDYVELALRGKMSEISISPDNIRSQSQSKAKL